MLIPFPSPPALRKVPDNVFPQLANAVDPPEVVVYVGDIMLGQFGANMQSAQQGLAFAADGEAKSVTVLKQEAVGMYEVAVLEAGSAAALKRWMDLHGYQYPEGMDQVAGEYIESGWCFVAVKTRVGQKAGADPVAGQQQANTQLPEGSVFDGHVQGMGFRFESDELVVPMRLSAFNGGDTRNVVYLLTDSPKKIRAIPEEFVQRQISGEQLVANLTQPLPLRIIGGTEEDLTDWHKQNLPSQRDPGPRNGVAKQLFADDLHAVLTGQMSLQHEESEKELLRIGEHFGLRGPEIDAANSLALKDDAAQTVAASLSKLDSMTLSVVDGDFPREVLARQNLTFAEYEMPSRRNTPQNYDAKLNGPDDSRKEGVLKIGALDWSHLRPDRGRPETSVPPTRITRQTSFRSSPLLVLMLAGAFVLMFGLCGIALQRRRNPA